MSAEIFDSYFEALAERARGNLDDVEALSAALGDRLVAEALLAQLQASGRGRDIGRADPKTLARFAQRTATPQPGTKSLLELLSNR